MGKFAYNPFNKDFVFCNGLHSDNLQNKPFYEYIRGNIENKELYIRAFYPFRQEVNDFTLQELYAKSKQLIQQFEKDLLQAIKLKYNIIPTRIVYNADKDLLNLGVR